MSIWRRLKRLLRRKRGILSLALLLFCVGALGLMNHGEPESQQVALYDTQYIGLSEENMLTLYQGPPEYNQVIETFFRIDTERLKTERPVGELERLKAGIEVKTAADYEAVLNIFRPFAAE